MILYAATSNPGKLQEFATAAQPAGIVVRALPGLATMPEPVEDASTFAGNAELKAIGYSNLVPGLLVLTDDSGLEAAALNGQPGVRSARYADDLAFDPHSGKTKDDRNNHTLLSQLAIHTDRSARFVCALALAYNGQVFLRVVGTVAGEILAAPQGADGFGYDPLFLVPSLGLTLAELTREQKWAISHRGHAFRSLLTHLQDSDIAQRFR